jgi:hypothetical protein
MLDDMFGGIKMIDPNDDNLIQLIGGILYDGVYEKKFTVDEIFFQIDTTIRQRTWIKFEFSKDQIKKEISAYRDSRKNLEAISKKILGLYSGV